jgi:hypothetical protein
MCHYAWRSAFFLSAKTQRFLFPSLALGQKGKLSKGERTKNNVNVYSFSPMTFLWHSFF